MHITLRADEINRVIADYFKEKHPTIQGPDAYVFVNNEGDPECSVSFNPFTPPLPSAPDVANAREE